MINGRVDHIFFIQLRGRNMIVNNPFQHSVYAPDEMGRGFSVDISDQHQQKHINRPHTWHPPTDFYEVEGLYIVRVEIAGMNTEDFLVNLNEQRLEISGTRPDVSLSRAYHQMEIPYGHFKTVINLPASVDSAGVVAEYHDGFLIITIPKSITYKIIINEE
jgi:HSP20 family protein